MEIQSIATSQFPFLDARGYLPTLKDTDTDRVNTKNSIRHSTKEESRSNKAIKGRLKLFESNIVSSNKSEKGQQLDKGQFIIKSISSQYHESPKKKQRLFESQQKQSGHPSSKKREIKKTHRRNKIFELNYSSKINNLHRVRSYESLEVDDNGVQVSNKKLMHKFESIIPVTQHLHKPIFSTRSQVLKDTHLNFIIPTVPFPPKQHILPKIDESSLFLPKSNFNKITFTYQKPNSQMSNVAISPNYLSHQFQSKQKVGLNLMDPQVRAFQSIQMGYSATTDKIHVNPAVIKIKKPKPTFQKIDGCVFKSDHRQKIIPYHMLKSSLISNPLMSKAEKRDYLGSKITKNCRESIIDRCLPNLQNESFSNIEEDNSQRYFDTDGELEPLAKKISFKNIEISHEKVVQDIQQDLQPQNLFMDFQNSHRQERQRRQIRLRQSKQKIQVQPIPILEENVEEKRYRLTFQQLIQGNLHVFLIILSAILLLIQCGS